MSEFKPGDIVMNMYSSKETALLLSSQRGWDGIDIWKILFQGRVFAVSEKFFRKIESNDNERF